jgi:hypothetical protein
MDEKRFKFVINLGDSFTLDDKPLRLVEKAGTWLLRIHDPSEPERVLTSQEKRGARYQMCPKSRSATVPRDGSTRRRDT